jgi:hypothetical protein
MDNPQASLEEQRPIPIFRSKRITMKTMRMMARSLMETAAHNKMI